MPLTIQINHGGSAIVPYIADVGLSGGSSFDYGSDPLNLGSLTNPAPAGCYRTVRYDTADATLSRSGFAASATVKLRIHVYVDGAASTVYSVTDAVSGNVLNVNHISGASDRVAGIYELTCTANSSGVVSVTLHQTGGSYARWMLSASEFIEQTGGTDTSPDITTTSLPATTVGASYSQTIAETGGEASLVWDVTVGSLPPGLSINSSTGAITGTPTTAGTYNFTVRVRDESAGAGAESDTQALSIVVNAAPDITTTSLPGGTQDSAYSQTVSKTGGTGSGTFSVVTGSLPTGLSLNSSTGAITGTPSATGTFNFTVRYTDTVGVYDNQALSIVISSSGGGGSAPVASFTKSPSSGTTATTFNFTDTSTNTPTSWAWDFGDGATSTAQNPTHSYSSPGTYTIQHTATNAYGTGTASTQTITISAVSGDDFIYNGITLPERCYKPAPDYAKVTRSHEYEDGGMSFNELNSTAPQEWQLEYTGLTEAEAAEFDAHFETKRYSRSFTFIGRDGTYEDCFYKMGSYEPDHTKTWINSRKITIIKYP